ncbi:PTS sugar transporter subunit IIB [Listeria fleischmannii]|jgi:PTS system cellobiose-specific IIB component|uniref:PTS system beta-glucoside-specific, IIB component n=2 Tax=Listeria fleischmannii TaxID=1069827 RepID=W7DLS1_9LIST|nr:PTS sugar transporter subunit IIB [Listeria fleischmannii]EIA21221.1 PTS system beta-glucoside-specific, IIB component [Listeria fleischmannii subsp. coloradonensis]EUJ52922.1 PTS system beta-glucoside-specific, IIB component [Listeria fleischmannii FSL S10-1203]MBC1398008.1 PTS sugar transporter subunit IIB [Listeria fleischmannii]MBC1417848.1 PTS sugar transporter subunit IIB [Listeria fleischmannii]MBC1426069.1 PTS sugar transporter subunit IIB [Listeria fleischmannii]
MKTIMLVCSAGMSTSLLVTKMEKAAEAEGMEAKIFAVAEAEADKHLDEIDVLLLGPQVRFLEGNMKKKLEPKGIPLGVINSVDYGMMKGDKVLEQAKDLMK